MTEPEGHPTLFARLLVWTDEAAQLDAIGAVSPSRPKPSAKGYSDMEIYRLKLPLRTTEEKVDSLERLAEDLLGIMNSPAWAHVADSITDVELRLVLLPADSINANFYLPRELIDALSKWRAHLYFSA